MKNSPGVDLNLPSKTEVLLYIPLTPMQKFWYMRLLTRADQGLLEELFQGAQQKEAVALGKEAQERGLWQEKGIGELEALEENKAHGGEAAIEWAESKEIMRQALEHERQDTKKSTAWKKLMNLLMQLRKVCLDFMASLNAEVMNSAQYAIRSTVPAGWKKRGLKSD